MEIVLIFAIFVIGYFQLKKLSKRLRAIENEFAQWKKRAASVHEFPKIPEVHQLPGVAEETSPLAAQGATGPRPAERPSVLGVDATFLRPSEVEVAAPQAPSISEQMKKRIAYLLDMEEMLGTNWLLKIGMALVVVGVALFLGYSLQHMGPYGKVLVGASVSVGAIVGGWFAERRKGYEIFGRVLQSGGWALAYFTAYATRYIEATRILNSDVAAFTLMMLVGAAMVARSLYYRSQFVTGFAFGLGYLTMVINSVGWHTLLASVLLTISIVIILWRLEWYKMEIGAVIGTYGIHLMWLYPIIQPMGAMKEMFPEFYASAALLGFYWLVFVVSHFLRRGRNPSQEIILQASLILNTVGLLGCFAYQAVYLQWAFWTLLVLGILCFALCYLSKRLDRRASYLVTSTLGSMLVVAAVPFRYSTETLSLSWLLQCEMFLMVGYRLREVHFRRLAVLASVPLLGYLLIHTISPCLFEPGRKDMAGGLVVLIAGVAFIANMLIAERRFKDLNTITDEKYRLDAYGYCGWLLILAASWMLISWVWWGLAVASGVCILHLAGEVFDERRLLIQAQLTVAPAALWVLSVNLPDGSELFGISQRILIGSASAFMLYGYSELARRRSVFQAIIHYPLHLCVNAPAASLILFVLLWYSLSGAAVALGWAVLGLALMETGRWQGRADLRWQGHLVTVAVFGRLLVSNLNAEGEFGWASTRLVTILPLVAMFYYLFSIMRKDAADGKLAPEEMAGGILAGAYATFALTSLLGVLYFEVSPIWVAAVWAAVSVVVMAVGKTRDILLFRTQAVVVTWLVLARCALENLYSTEMWRLWNSRIVVLSIVSLILLLGFVITRFHRDKATTANQGIQITGVRRALQECDIHSHHFFFFAALVVITALLWREASAGGYLTAAWAVEALAVFILAVLLKERPYRLFAMGLLLVCVVKVILMDVWLLRTFPRIIAFIVLGVTLVLVSFFYTRYRDSWRKILLG